MAHQIQYRQMSAVLREIRLLRIDEIPEPSGLDRDLKCSMEHVILDSPSEKPYAAMSYCWGPIPKQSSITLDGREVTVPQSAVHALRNVIRAPGERLWVDAVCINQQDLPEKGRQVAMMKDIYTHAQEVRIWLGHLDDNTAVRALEAIRRIHEQCRRETNDLRDLDSHLYGRSGGGFKYSDAPLPTDCDWEAVRALYSFPWFTRLWVVQEAALARQAVCNIGNHTIDMEVVALTARWMVHRRYPRHFGGSEIEGIENASNMYRPTGGWFGNQLRNMHRQGCKDPRDRVYGVLGLLRPETAAAITPDYTATVLEVYAQALRVSFFENKSLYLLRFVAWYVDEPVKLGLLTQLGQRLWWPWRLLWRGNEMRQWPSWVAKLHASTDSAYHACLDVQTFEESDWALQIQDVGNPLILSVKGLDIDRVVSTSDAFTVESMRDSQAIADIVTWCLRQAEETVPAAVREEALEDLRHAFICGVNMHNADSEMDAGLKSDYKAFTAWCKSHESQPLQRHHQEPDPDYERYRRHMGRAENRRIFFTAGGRVGLGPYHTRAGDHLCILTGTIGCYILRPEGSDSWKLIGDAYCRRLMKNAHLGRCTEYLDREARSSWFNLD
ncbi:HET-domain-containing protein [Podospora conica]|nr:HET-domain-containing protein [Schizothecium conicum]